jgi:UDP-glucose 4-epimerase
MSLLVTGGQGFVMSHLVRHWAERHRDERVVILDREAPDAVAARFFAPIADRLAFIKADILDRAAWMDSAAAFGIDRIAHGAALTPHAYVEESGRPRDPEREAPERIIDVNLGGTLTILAFAQRLRSCRRIVLVSTGSVYGEEGPHDRPLPEDGYVAPVSLYGISKLAAELVALRYRALFDLSVVAARLASVYGPMDRQLPSRHVVCVPNRMTSLALAGESIRIESATAVGDFIHAADVARALAVLLEAEAPRHRVYNIGSGALVSHGELAELTTRLVPGSTWSLDAQRPNVAGDPARRFGQWGAYDIARIGDEFGWRPDPLAGRLAAYIDWRRVEEGPWRG